MRLRLAAFAFSLTLLSALGEAPTPLPADTPVAPALPPPAPFVFVAPLLPNAPYESPPGLLRAQARERETSHFVGIAETAANEAEIVLETAADFHLSLLQGAEGSRHLPTFATFTDRLTAAADAVIVAARASNNSNRVLHVAAREEKEAIF
jgi:hypothetical protein